MAHELDHLVHGPNDITEEEHLQLHDRSVLVENEIINRSDRLPARCRLEGYSVIPDSTGDDTVLKMIQAINDLLKHPHEPREDRIYAKGIRDDFQRIWRKVESQLDV